MIIVHYRDFFLQLLQLVFIDLREFVEGGRIVLGKGGAKGRPLLFWGLLGFVNWGNLFGRWWFYAVIGEFWFLDFVGVCAVLGVFVKSVVFFFCLSFLFGNCGHVLLRNSLQWVRELLALNAVSSPSVLLSHPIAVTLAVYALYDVFFR
jgi:hypothetical protein